ncbi:AMP-binding enzyme [Arenibaculum sp.]|uniref:AMP-binding enzyme n=1 Tax=Arenibaculum sp. TaxID=2865862 RepID=UPI002E130A26|nr:AMP-binding protein [Arenibaculum sp.]
MTSAPAWWSRDEALSRFVADLVAGEFARLRPGWPQARPAGGFDPAMALGAGGSGAGGLGADSLELLQVAAALTEALHLHRSGIEDYLLARPTAGEWVAVCRAALSRFDREITFRTSGSTGLGKPCPHRLDTLEQEAAALAALAGPRRRVLSAVPSHHIYGFLFTILVPNPPAGDGPAVPVLDLRDRSPASLAALLRPGDLVVGHPEFWQAVRRSGATFPRDVVGTTSTAPCPDDLAADLRERGLARLLQVFGSSETAGIGWRDEPGAGFLPFPWWRRHGVAGLVRRLPDGGRLELALQDLIDWRDDGTFAPLGRLDTVVQVGGINVSLDGVRAHLLRHEHVADAAVRLMRPDEGSRLKAFIVPAPGAPGEPELQAALAAWIETALPAAQRPRSLAFGPSLPRTPAGKASDWEIPGR